MFNRRNDSGILFIGMEDEYVISSLSMIIAVVFVVFLDEEIFSYF